MAAPVLTGLTKTNLSEQAPASLRTANTSGQLAPGTQMVETERGGLTGQRGVHRIGPFVSP